MSRLTRGLNWSSGENKGSLYIYGVWRIKKVFSVEMRRLEYVWFFFINKTKMTNFDLIFFATIGRYLSIFAKYRRPNFFVNHPPSDKYFPIRYQDFFMTDSQECHDPYFSIAPPQVTWKFCTFTPLTYIKYNKVLMKSFFHPVSRF